MTLASRLLKSLKVIGTDTDRSATYDFLLVFHSNYGPNALYEIRGEKRIIAKVPHVCIFNAAAEGVPWNIVTAVGLKSTLMPCQTVKTTLRSAC